jgi:hypothetical protein
MSKEEARSGFQLEISWLIEHIGSIRRMLPPFAEISGQVYKQVRKDYDEFIEKHATDKLLDSEGKIESFAMPPQYASDYRHVERAMADTATFTKLLPRLAFVGLVSVYDAYLGKLLRQMFRNRPELLNASNRQLTYQQLNQFESVTDACEWVVEKEVEAVLRDSHVAHFQWLENKLAIPLRKDLAVWGSFVELTERRNLFVHTDGIVSSQYLQVCREQGAPLPDVLNVGDQLQVSPQYFQQSCDSIAEIGVKLGQVVWRKLLPGEKEKADESLLIVSYDALVMREYELAATLCHFACETLPMLSSAEFELMFRVNLAIAYRGLGRTKEALALVEKTDWSACADKFKLAAAVLREDWNTAAQIMKRVGAAGEPSKEQYGAWPLFKEFRKKDIFRTTFEAVFGEPFRIRNVASAATDLQPPEQPEKKESDDAA